MSLKSLKLKIRGINKTRQVTKAMEAVSAVKMRKSQERAFMARPYAVTAAALLKRLSTSFDIAEHPLVKVRPIRKVLLIVITSDRGLAGSLNSSLIASIRRFITEHKLSKESLALICLGRKGFEYFSKRGFTLLAHHERLSDTPDQTLLRSVADECTALYAVGSYDRVMVCYSNFISTLNQQPAIRQMLPFKPQELEAVITGIAPAKGKYAEDQVDVRAITAAPASYSYEPSPEQLYRTLLPILLTAITYHGALESKASEFSARMIAMKNASDKAKDLSHTLTRKYNKIRQSSITREVSEIIGGMEALA